MFCQCVIPSADDASRYLICGTCSHPLPQAMDAFQEILANTGAKLPQISGSGFPGIPAPHVLASRIVAPDHLKPKLYGPGIWDATIDISQDIQVLVGELASNVGLKSYITALSEYQQLSSRAEGV